MKQVAISGEKSLFLITVRVNLSFNSEKTTPCCLPPLNDSYLSAFVSFKIEGMFVFAGTELKAEAFETPRVKNYMKYLDFALVTTHQISRFMHEVSL